MPFSGFARSLGFGPLFDFTIPFPIMPPTLRGKVILAITLHFLVDLRRALLHYAVREPMIGSFAIP